MKNLADSHWTKKYEGEGRIEWCRRYKFFCLIVRSVSPKTVFICQFHIHVLIHSVCQEYFLDGGMKRMLEKDEKSANVTMGVTALAASPQPYNTIRR